MSLPPPSPKHAQLIWLALAGLAVFVLAALVVALIWGLGKVLELMAPVLWPLAVAGVAAYLLDPVVDFLERKRVPRIGAIVSVFAMAIVIVLTMVGSVLPQIITETRDLAVRIPDYSAQLQRRIEVWGNNPPASLRRYLLRENQAPSATNEVTGTNASAGLKSENNNTSDATNATPA